MKQKMFEFLSEISLFGWILISIVVVLLWKAPALLRGRGILKSEDDDVVLGDGKPDNYFTNLDSGGD